MGYKEKIEQLGGIYVRTFPDGGLSQVYDWANSLNGGVALANENSMVDTERIDQLDCGRTTPQTVNLESMMGNKRVLELVDLMKQKGNIAFFPGTLLRDFGGYSMQTMPLIADGDLVGERVKQTGQPSVDDYRVLAREMGGEEYARQFRFSTGSFFTEPYKGLREKLMGAVNSLKDNSPKSLIYRGLNILPVICNELNSIPELYNGEPVDVVLHSSSCLFDNNSEMEKSYGRFLDRMKSQGKLRNPAILAVAEYRPQDSFSGIFGYNGEKLERLN